MLLRHSLLPTRLLLAIACVAANAAAQDETLKALDGVWLYVEDRTEGRPVEKRSPPMSVRCVLRVEEGALVMVRPRGDERIPFDGTSAEDENEGSVTRRTGSWKDGTFTYDADISRKADGTHVTLIRRQFRVTAEGLEVRVAIDPPDGRASVALYQHPEDIALPKPAAATIGDLAWLAGAWTGERGRSSIEERWSPPLGGAMLGVSRTVSGGAMKAFEYLRVVERDGGLVYVAQPGGKTATEFVLTELSATRVVFDNPRHDYPQRIVYELADDGAMTASIGFVNGGSPRRFEFAREER